MATRRLATKIEDWQVLPDIGSDHFAIMFDVKGTDTQRIPNPMKIVKYNVKLANWDLFSTVLRENVFRSLLLQSPELQDHVYNPRQSLELLQGQQQDLSDMLNEAAQSLTNCIINAADASIPQVKPGAQAKAWWTPLLKELREKMI